MPSYALKRKVYKYYKDTVVTKYWKEVTTETEETVLAYACYWQTDGSILGTFYHYAKAPLGSDLTVYSSKKNTFMKPATGVDDIGPDPHVNSTFASITENQAVLVGQQGDTATFFRKSDYDLYTTGTITTTTTVEGTPDDYTYTTTETVTTEVTANDDYNRVETDANTYFPMRRQQDVNGVTQFTIYSFNRK